MRTMASPGRGGHLPALRAAEEVYAAREAAAELFNVEDSAGVVFTSNATHALNIAIGSLAKPGTRVVISGFEHNSVTRPLAAIDADIRPAGTKLFDTADTLADFEAKIKDVELVVCTHVSNVFGYVLPVYEIGELCRARSVPFIVDASQSAGVLDVDFRREKRLVRRAKGRYVLGNRRLSHKSFGEELEVPLCRNRCRRQKRYIRSSRNDAGSKCAQNYNASAGQYGQYR